MKKTQKMVSRILAIFMIILSFVSIMIVPVSAASSRYQTIVYNIYDYKQVSTSTAILRSQPKSVSKTVYATLYKGALIKTVGTTKSEGKTWYKIQVDSSTYYLPASNVKSSAYKLTAQLFMVTKNNAPLRATPYDSGSVVERLPQNTLVRVVGEVRNKYGNLWYEVVAQGSSRIRYIYSNNVTTNFGTTNNMRLDQDVYFQTTNYTCSAATTLSVLRYANLLNSTSDTSILKYTNYSVGGIVNKLNAELGYGTYTWSTFTSTEQYERAIRFSLLQGSAPIARVRFSRQYFSYSSDGHFTTIIGIYKKNGETWLELKDSFVNRYASNSYSDRYTGTVHIPLKTLYNYGTYYGTSAIYLIYNP